MGLFVLLLGGLGMLGALAGLAHGADRHGDRGRGTDPRSRRPTRLTAGVVAGSLLNTRLDLITAMIGGQRDRRVYRHLATPPGEARPADGAQPAIGEEALGCGQIGAEPGVPRSWPGSSPHCSTSNSSSSRAVANSVGGSAAPALQRQAQDQGAQQRGRRVQPDQAPVVEPLDRGAQGAQGRLGLRSTGMTPSATARRASNWRSAQSSQGCQAARLPRHQLGRALGAVAEQVGAGIAGGLGDRVGAPGRHQVDDGGGEPGQPHGARLDRRRLARAHSAPMSRQRLAGTASGARAGVRTGRPSSSTTQPLPSLRVPTSV